MSTPTYQEMLARAKEELIAALGMQSYSANGTTVTKQSIDALQKNIEWLEQQIVAEEAAAAGTVSGDFVPVVNI